MRHIDQAGQIFAPGTSGRIRRRPPKRGRGCRGARTSAAIEYWHGRLFILTPRYSGRHHSRHEASFMGRHRGSTRLALREPLQCRLNGHRGLHRGGYLACGPRRPPSASECSRPRALTLRPAQNWMESARSSYRLEGSHQRTAAGDAMKGDGGWTSLRWPPWAAGSSGGAIRKYQDSPSSRGAPAGAIAAPAQGEVVSRIFRIFGAAADPVKRFGW
jgi:hypothetical protein